MPLITCQCRNCGTVLEMDPGTGTILCPSCGTPYIYEPSGKDFESASSGTTENEQNILEVRRMQSEIEKDRAKCIRGLRVCIAAAALFLAAVGVSVVCGLCGVLPFNYAAAGVVFGGAGLISCALFTKSCIDAKKVYEECIEELSDFIRRKGHGS